MKPVLFSFGALHLYSYGLSIAVGVLISLFLMQRRAAQEGFPGKDDVLDISFSVLIWGFLGARLFYGVQNFSYYLSYPLKIFAVWEGGLIVYGGLVFGLLGFWLMLRKKKIPFWKMLDFIAPYTALSQAFGRIGCFLNGCCYGKACALPWAVRFPEMTHAVHPAQLYEAIFDLWLFAFLLAYRKKSRFDGQTGLAYFLLYGLGRFFVEFLREPGWAWQGITFNQWLSVAVIFAAFLFFQFRKRKKT
jgi:phosphatidylglycerol:prolipoprotein diacylglycerol transferase